MVFLSLGPVGFLHLLVVSFPSSDFLYGVDNENRDYIFNYPCYYSNNINSENNHVSLGLAQWEVYSVKWNDGKYKNYTITPQTNLSTAKIRQTKRKAVFKLIRNEVRPGVN